jgi:hypothetical protein
MYLSEGFFKKKIGIGLQIYFQAFVAKAFDEAVHISFKKN